MLVRETRGKKQKLLEEHKQYMHAYMLQQDHKKIWLSDIQQDLMRRFPEIKSIARSTLARALKG